MKKENTGNQNHQSLAERLNASTWKHPERALLLTAPNPLDNKLRIFKVFYLPILIIAGIVAIFNLEYTILVLFALVIYCAIDSCVTSDKTKALRNVQFKFDSSIDNDTIFQEVMPILTKKYGMLVERLDDGSIRINHQDVMYNIIIGKQNTFKLYWGLSLGRALLPTNYYKLYKKCISAMGIMAYEIQNAFNIK